MVEKGQHVGDSPNSLCPQTGDVLEVTVEPLEKESMQYKQKWLSC